MFFVFDVETIPDFQFLRDVMQLDAEDEAYNDEEAVLTLAQENLTRNNSNFLPPMYHRMISWVGLWIDNNGDPHKKVAWSGENEEEGLEKLFDLLSTYKDFGLIHHNGKGFDLPLLTYRAMKHQLVMPQRMHSYDIRYRYSKANIDLLDEFSNYGASSWPKLKHLGYLIDIPFKKTAEGDQVLEMFQNGELEAIEHYCYEDVMATYIVWLHLKHTMGDIPSDRFEDLNSRALDKLKSIQEENA